MDKVTRRQRHLLTRCTELINSRYGTHDSRREGYPHILGSYMVNCKDRDSRTISVLRDAIFDVASQVKENTGERQTPLWVYFDLCPPPPLVQWLGVVLGVVVYQSTGC